jgi:hypothetical protein
MDPEIENLNLAGNLLCETSDEFTLLFEPDVLVVTFRLPDSTRVLYSSWMMTSILFFALPAFHSSFFPFNSKKSPRSRGTVT